MKLRAIFALFLCFTVGIALAADPAPLSIMKGTTTRMLSALQKNQSRLHNRAVIDGIVRTVVLPQMDVGTIARSVVGRKYWYEASNKQQAQFVRAFTHYVINMYSTSLSSYSDERITFRPLRDFDSNQSRVQVYSIVKRPGREPIALNYRLVRLRNGWKVYDFSVGGVSMVQNYRAQFADTLNQGGLALLIKKLQSQK